jgi:hypothetical protein
LEQEDVQAEHDDQSITEERPGIVGTHDTMDMELDIDEVDAEVSSVTTAAQCQMHLRHVSRLSAMPLLSVGGHVSDTLGNKYYTSPRNFPPLDEHLYGASLLGDQRPLIALHPHPHWQMTVRNACYRNLKTIQSAESGQEMQQDLQ